MRKDNSAGPLYRRLIPGELLLAGSIAAAPLAGDMVPPAMVQEKIPMVSTASSVSEDRMQGGYLNAGSGIGDILNHPAFAGFARLLLPWDDRSYDENMRLSDFGSLLPYHRHVDPDVVVDGLNHMIDAVSKGETLFYHFYSQAQRRADPSKDNTGLFFLRGRPGAPFAMIAPGGGFAYVGSVHEGFPYAVEISDAGYHAFVLKYRTGYGGETATRDLAAALSFVFINAEMLGVSTGNYSLWGSSAGARMAASIGSHGAARFGGSDLAKPATVVMAYTGHSDYAADEPPTFVVVGENDGIAPPSAMQRRVARLRAAGTGVEYHQYPDLAHGFGPGTGTPAEGWIADAVRFWSRNASRQADKAPASGLNSSTVR
jgi:acetyl esterase/lipase